MQKATERIRKEEAHQDQPGPAVTPKRDGITHMINAINSEIRLRSALKELVNESRSRVTKTEDFILNNQHLASSSIEGKKIHMTQAARYLIISRLQEFGGEHEEASMARERAVDHLLNTGKDRFGALRTIDKFKHGHGSAPDGTVITFDDAGIANMIRTRIAVNSIPHRTDTPIVDEIEEG